MAMKKRSLTSPPIEWVDNLETHALELRRLRMLWRRGRSPYRPLVPFEINLEDLDAQPDSEWDRLELPETNFEWGLDPEDEPERREWAQATVDELWEIASAWTRESGLRCDFQLVGYGEDGQVLFEDGRQCWSRPPGSRAPRGSAAPPRQAAQRPVTDPQQPVTVVGLDYQAINDLEGRKDRFIDRLTGDRDWSFNTAQEAMTAAQRSMSAAPTVLEQAGDILHRSISYQEGVFTRLHEQAEETSDSRKHAVTEQELTKRMEIRAKTWRHFLDNTLTVAGPLANSVMGWVTNRRVNVMPTFNKAQEAMVYLFYSLTPTRVVRFCESEKAASNFLAVLQDGAKFKSERDAVLHIEGLILFLRDEEFELVATTEEQLAARFIIGRFAMYKANETAA